MLTWPVMNRTFRTLATVLLVLQVSFPVAWSQDDSHRVEVRPGDTLFGIVRLHYPGSPSRWSLIENEVYVANPHAFSNNNKSLLRVGAILDMPVYEAPEAASKTEPAVSAPPPRDLVIAGATLELSGAPIAIDINDQQRLLTLRGSVFVGDVIVTQGDSAAHLQMIDGSHLYLRAGSRLVIDDYRFVENTPQSSRSIIRLLKGGFRAITGLIGQRNPAAVNVVTSVATIGVRGTDFAVRICGPDECALPEYGVFEPGDYSGVLGGEITITNAAGTTPVAFGEVVRTSSPDSSPVPAPEAAALIFSDAELALLNAKNSAPMNFFQWLRSWIFRSDSE